MLPFLPTHVASVSFKHKEQYRKKYSTKIITADLMILIAIFGIQAGVAILTYGQYTSAQLMA